MATITKKELIDRIANSTKQRRILVKKIVQLFLDEIIAELGRDNRLEFRDFGVFEIRVRRPRRAQNPKTLEPVQVPEKRSVKFKAGRLMRQCVSSPKPVIAASEPQPQAKAVASQPADTGALGAS